MSEEPFKLLQKLTQMLSWLIKIAEEFNVAVYLTNQGKSWKKMICRLNRHNAKPWPMSFAAIVQTAVDIVERSGRPYQVLVILADGHVTQSVDTYIGALNPQVEKTINSISKPVLVCTLSQSYWSESVTVLVKT